jgi:hypothetical protein
MRLTVVDESKENGMNALFQEKKPIKGKRSARSNARKSAVKQVDAREVETLFDFWRLAMKKKALLSDERRAILAWAILNYGMETCEMAIKGCLMSDWHMGRNPNNVRYDSVELIFRNSEKIEWFTDKYRSSVWQPPPGDEPF